jgi:hypothetical protein
MSKFIQITSTEGDEFIQNINNIDCLRRPNAPSRYQHNYSVIFSPDYMKEVSITKEEYDRLKAILLEEKKGGGE